VTNLSSYQCPEQDDLKTTGVLTSDEIEHYARKYRMIDPFESGSLKAAGYELHLGEDYAMQGRRGKLVDEPGKDELEIPPFEVVIVSIKEIINLPRFIIARWNLRVKKVYEGLLWIGALQVDPGWVGQLFCPIYNLSNKPILLRLGEHVLLMDFVKTTPFTKGKSKEYHRPPRRQKIDDYNWGLESALFTTVGRRIDETEKRVNRFESMIGIMFASIAVLFVALSIFASSAEKLQVSLPLWVYLSVGLSIAAIAISLSRRFKFQTKGKVEFKTKDKWFKILVIAYIVVSANVIIMLCIRTLW